MAVTLRSRSLKSLPTTNRRRIGPFSKNRTGSSVRIGSRTSPRPTHSCKKVAELAESEGHHPDVSFGWGYVTVSLQTKKMKGLHENDFIMAPKLDELASQP